LALLKKLGVAHATYQINEPIDNLRQIQRKGIAVFLENEKKKWECTECEVLVCIQQRNVITAI
jgi:hypothetical protein